AGVPLIEIVTEPVLTSSEEAGAFLLEVRKLVRYLDICDGNMEEGSLRCDANVSIMLADATEFGKKVEIKNMNSIRNVQRAIDNEIARQITEVEKGRAIISETRTYDANLDKTFGMRTKEELNDYRYFPDPDLSPMEVSDAWLEKIRSHMPLLPDQLKQKLISDYQLPAYDAQVLTDEKEIAFYFMEICTHTTNFKAASNWMMGPVKSYLNDKSVSVQNFPITPAMMASLIAIIDEGVVNFSVASQKIFPVMAEHPDKSPKAIAKELDLIQESDASTLVPIVDQVIKEFPLKVEEYKNGKKGIVSMFMGEVMKRTKGNADPKLSTELLTKKLNEL
ncbi:MAG: Asp-tRNA(Asn)/Glu-tRNA(Gln) amidotransferase subunit GatB, partial [Cyclobacteriaceae bacterium]|nr:Asp-tRNA(Asn)/Glu-tRNA(Gln) amidotransferase subunit GatB [Cyclobacteriaceae bacterium]